MQGQFPCPECGQPILIMIHRKGDVAKCLSCGAKTEVPETLGEVPLMRSPLEPPPTLSPTPDRSTQPSVPLAETAYNIPHSGVADAEVDTLSPIQGRVKFRTIHLICVSLNGAYFLMYLVGLLVSDLQPSYAILYFLYLTFPMINIWGLSSASAAVNYRITIYNLCCILLFVLGILMADDVEGRMWLGVVIGLAILNIIGLSIQKGDSWLSLYLERKQLEERSKIRALRKSLDESSRSDTT